MAALTVATVRFGLGRLREIALFTMAAIGIGLLATPVSAHAENNPYFFRRNDPTILRCHQTPAGAELCIHPAYIATVTSDLERLVGVSAPRLRMLGFPVARFSQVPSMRLSNRAPRTIYFEVSPATVNQALAAVTLMYEHGARLRIQIKRARVPGRVNRTR